MDESLVARYPELERSHFWWRTRRKLIEELISGVSVECPTVLDVGCGSGVTARSVASSGASVVGVDLEPENESMSDERFQYVCGDFLDLTADLGEFDVVLALDAVEHFANESQMLEAIYTNTRPGGMAIVTVPAYAWLWSSHDEQNRHFRRYTRRRITKAMADVGFTVRRVGYLFGALLFPKALVATLERARSRPFTVMSMPKPVINRLAGTYFCLETELASRFRNFLPFGTSVVAVAHRPIQMDPSSSERRR